MSNPDTGEAFYPIILGSDINAYGIARSIYAEYGICSTIVCSTVLTYCRYTRFIKTKIIEPNIENDDIFVKTLKELAKNHLYRDKKLLLLPCGDGYAKLITKHKDSLKNLFIFPNTDHNTFLKLATKESFYELCQTKNVPYPKTSLCTKETYKNLSIDLSFPLIVKPSNSAMYWQTRFPGKKKVFIANNNTELNLILEAVYNSTYTDPLILQEYIPGDDSNIKEVIVYINRHDDVEFMLFVDVILEECTPDGLGSIAGATVGYNQTVFDTVIQFLKGTGYRGFAGFDIKFDSRDNQYKFFEMNLRLTRTSFIMTGAGYNFSRFIVDDLILQKDSKKIILAKDDVLYRIIPAKLLFKYCNDPKIHQKMRSLIAGKKVCTPFFDSKNDCGLLRCFEYLRNQSSYSKKYKKYFYNRSY